MTHAILPQGWHNRSHSAKNVHSWDATSAIEEPSGIISRASHIPGTRRVSPRQFQTYTAEDDEQEQKIQRLGLRRRHYHYRAALLCKASAHAALEPSVGSPATGTVRLAKLLLIDHLSGAHRRPRKKPAAGMVNSRRTPRPQRLIDWQLAQTGPLRREKHADNS